MLTCRQIQGFLEHVKTGQRKRNHPGQRNIPCVSDTCVFSRPSFQLCLQFSLRETSKITMEKKTLITVDSYLRSCCSLTGMVLHLDLLNYGKAVDRLSNCLLLSVSVHSLYSTRCCSCQWALHSLAAASRARWVHLAVSNRSDLSEVVIIQNHNG